jgi:hypothetical protein
LPEVHRWAYDFSVPGASEDFIPQNMPADETHATVDDHDESEFHADESAESAAGEELFGEDD